MLKVVQLYKQIGETPLELLNKFKKDNPNYTDIKMAYAGRLDPMAHGLMLYLVGDECKKRDKYQDMDKTYEFDLVLGFQTDTQDALGLVTNENISKLGSNYTEDIKSHLSRLTGKHLQKYPPYSSKAIDGVPMYQLAREGRLDPDQIPSKEIEIYTAEYISSSTVNSKELYTDIQERISKVTGDFRQDEILKRWGEILLQEDIQIPTHKVMVSASSGTYMRSIADNIGKELGTYAFAWDIYRTKVGKYLVTESINITA